MDRCYRPLLPSKASSEDSVNSLRSPLDSIVTDQGSQDYTETRKKRQQIIVACNACRKRKSKCDGQRPTCNACVHKNTVCAWTADPDAPPIIALKRKYDALKKDSQDMRNVLNLLRTQPEEEAQENLSWIRASNDLDSALSSISQSCTTPTTPRGPIDVLDGQHSSKRGRSTTGLGIGPGIPNVYQPHTGSQCTSEAGSLDRSPSTIASSTFCPRRVSIHDLLNDGPASPSSSSVHSRNRSWDEVSALPPLVTRAAIPGFDFHGRSSYPTHVPAFRVYA